MDGLIGARVAVTGATGFLGKHVMKALKDAGATGIPITRSSGYDLRIESQAIGALTEIRPEVVIHLAGTVGGIIANMNSPATFFRDNMLMGMNVVHACNLARTRLVVTGTICFPAGTMIRMADGSYKAIETIQEGHHVVSATGKARRVNRVMQRSFTGRLMRIRAKGTEPIVCTPEHPFLTKRGWVEAKELKIDDRLIHVSSKNVRREQIRLLHGQDYDEAIAYKAVMSGSSAGRVRWSPRLISDLPSVEQPIEGDIAWLLGMFVADGFCTPETARGRRRGSKNEIGFTPGWNQELAEEIANHFERVWGVRPIIRRNRTSLLVTIGHRLACDFFSKCYKGAVHNASEKVVPEFIMNASPAAKRDFLRGYWLGDGYFKARGPDRPGQFLATSGSVSHVLMLQIRDLLFDMGVWSGIYKRYGRQGHTIEGRSVIQRDSWVTRTTGPSAVLLRDILRGGSPSEARDREVNIRSIEWLEESATEVYNLSVDEDESYLVGGLGVHNCSYPKDCQVPFREEDLWNGFPEPTNAPYGVAKKALLVMCQAYRKQHDFRFAYLMPTNIFGPFDNFQEKSSHVIPALMKRFIEAKEKGIDKVTCFGTGKVTRSFLYARDAAEAIVLAAKDLDYDEPINLPGCPEISMIDLATVIAKIVDYRGAIEWDTSKPDGQPRRAIDGTRVEKLLCWKPMTTLANGLETTLHWYYSHRHDH
jgi:nucleoside-diphosphate-sugar epimerase